MRSNDSIELDQLAYSPDSAARAVDSGRNLIFDEIKAGRLEARKAGRKTLITREALQAWLNSLPVRTSAAA